MLTGALTLFAILVQPWMMERARHLGGEAFSIQSTSMALALVPGDHLFVTPGVSELVRRGEVLVLRDEQGHNRLQRVAGVSGDTLEMRRFQLSLNGSPAG